MLLLRVMAVTTVILTLTGLVLMVVGFLMDAHVMAWIALPCVTVGLIMVHFTNVVGARYRKHQRENSDEV